MTVSVNISTANLQLVIAPPDRPEIVVQVPAPVTVKLAAQGVPGPRSQMVWASTNW
jgi:hypothetical protein